MFGTGDKATDSVSAGSAKTRGVPTRGVGQMVGLVVAPGESTRSAWTAAL